MDKSLQILAGLKDTFHKEKDGWLFMPELRTGTGFGKYSEQRIDAYALQCWTTKAHGMSIEHASIAYEIKQTKTDLIRELLNPDKRWMAKMHSHYFYWVVPDTLDFDANIIPDDEGLISYCFNEQDVCELQIRRQAKGKYLQPPRWDFVASIARRVVNMQDGHGNRKGD